MTRTDDGERGRTRARARRRRHKTRRAKRERAFAAQRDRESLQSGITQKRRGDYGAAAASYILSWLSTKPGAGYLYTWYSTREVSKKEERWKTNVLAGDRPRGVVWKWQAMSRFTQGDGVGNGTAIIEAEA